MQNQQYAEQTNIFQFQLIQLIRQFFFSASPAFDFFGLPRLRDGWSTSDVTSDRYSNVPFLHITNTLCLYGLRAAACQSCRNNNLKINNEY